MKLSSTIFLFIITFSALLAQSVNNDSPNSEDYYIFPIRPGQTNYLAGNMGELRTSHFHAGLDIRTEGRTGLPVYAAADGYISRISITVSGYGKALYISHPNGEITLYAHLSSFSDKIGKYTIIEQYKGQKSHIKLFPKENELMVKKGDIIAYSGNSGSSAGPHLHFEIRDQNNTVLNPLKYHFEEIKDTHSPIIKKLAIVPRSTSARINNQFQRQEYDVFKKSTSEYFIQDTIKLYGKVGFELFTYDLLNGANFKCGVSEIAFKLNNELIFQQRIDSLSFSNQRDILTHYNYANYVKSGNKFHKMYVDDGNSLDFYNTNSLNGNFIFEEECIYNGKVDVRDIYGNKSELQFVVKCSLPSLTIPPSSYQLNEVSQLNNILIITTSKSDSLIQVIINDNTDYHITPEYASHKGFTYLWDLNKGIPEGIDLCDTLVVREKSERIPSSFEYDFFSKNVKTHFYKNSLFDTIYYFSKYVDKQDYGMELFILGNPTLYPLRSRISVKLSPQKKYIKEKTSVYKIQGKSKSYYGGKWDGNLIEFTTRDFGNYTLLTDTIPPSIKPIIVNDNDLKFKIKDELSGIKEFSVFINNEWILMDYDYKTNMIWSVDYTHKKTNTVNVNVVVTDNLNNETIYTTKIY